MTKAHKSSTLAIVSETRKSAEPTEFQNLALESASLYETLGELEEIEKDARSRMVACPENDKEKYAFCALMQTALAANEQASDRLEAIDRHILDAEPQTAIDALIKLIIYYSEVDTEDYVAAVIEATNAEERSRIVAKAEHENKRFTHILQSIIRGFEKGLGVSVHSLGLTSHFEPGIADLPALIAKSQSEAKRLLG